MDERFLKFSVSIARVNKIVQKLKLDGMKTVELKGAHTLCLYRLLQQPEGLTAGQLARDCDFDPGLASRTLKELLQRKTIRKIGEDGKYGAQYFLTEQGNKIAEEIDRIARQVQQRVDDGISPEELAVFYRVLGKLEANFEKLCGEDIRALAALPNETKRGQHR